MTSAKIICQDCRQETEKRSHSQVRCVTCAWEAERVRERDQAKLEGRRQEKRLQRSSRETLKTESFNLFSRKVGDSRGK